MLANVRLSALPAVLLVLLAATVPAAGKDKSTGGATYSKVKGAPPESRTADESAEIATFVLGNTVFTLYHELAHALVDQLRIPVLGREEDAADGLAVLMMLPEKEDPYADELLLSAADGYGLADDQGEPDDLAFWDEHSLDLQRYAAVTCLIFGSDPEGFADLAQAIEMPAEQQERCPEIFGQTAASWAALLEPHTRKDGAPGGHPISLRFERPGRGIDPGLVALLKGSAVLREAVETVAQTFVLPAGVAVVFAACDESNAFYDPDTRDVTICYELVAYFAELVANDLAAR